jgi:ribosomal protein S18 acetylase RimI-like enzyme
MTGAEQVAAWRRGQRALVCDHMEPWRFGALYGASDFPSYYDYNLLHVGEGDPGADAAALAAVADELQAGLAHRRVEVADEQAGRRLRPGFEALGWRADRLAWLGRPAEGLAAGPPAGTTLRTATFEEARPLRLAWKAEEPWGDAEDFYVTEETVAARRGVRTVLAETGGEAAGFTSFSVAGELAEVELAYCVPERRSGGIGGALVARAVAEAGAAGAADVLIVADDDGDARRLYERLGFRLVTREHVFTRLPPAG